jgi:hypothetical protein
MGFNSGFKGLKCKLRLLGGIKSFDNENARLISAALSSASTYFTGSIFMSFHSEALRNFKVAFRLSHLRIRSLPAADKLLPSVVMYSYGL